MTDCLNPLTTNDTYMHCLTLDAYYQLMQSILKTGFALAKGWERGWWAGFSFTGVKHMVGCRMALVTGWTICYLVGANMSWCSQGYEHPENGSMKPWLKFPVWTKLSRYL